MTTNRSSFVRCIGVLLLLISLNSFGQTITKDSWGKGIRINAQDSSFTLKLGFRFQSLYTGVKNTDSNEWTDAFLIRRARLKFDGWAFDPRFVYKVELAISNRDTRDGAVDPFGNTANMVLDAVLKYNFAPNWSLWMGQTKLPGNRERVVSSQKMQFVDRSLVNGRYNLDRDVGVQLRHKDKAGNFVIKEMFAVSLGNGRNVIINDVGGYQYTGRLELLPMGEFASKGDYFGSDLKREPKPKLAIGLTADYNSDAIRSRGNLGGFVYDDEGNFVSNSLTTYFVDAIFKYKGFSAHTEYANRASGYESDQFGTGTGFNIQAGYLLPGDFEIAGRYTDIDARDVSRLVDQTEYTLGFSKYVVGHALKFQTDFSYHDFSDNFDNFFRFRFQFEVAL